MSVCKIGARIKEFREEAGISLETLAQKAGLKSEQLQLLEETGLDPSLGTLVKIARALGFRLGTFLDDELTEDPHIVRKADREACQGVHGGQANVNQNYAALGRGKADRNMEPFIIELVPGDAGHEHSSHEGEEFIYVRSGQVALSYGDKTYVLDAGDSMYYNSVVPHWVGCAGDQPATIVAVVYVPF